MLLGEIVKLVNQGCTGVKLQLFQLFMVRTREAIGIGFTLFTVHCTLVCTVYMFFSLHFGADCSAFSGLLYKCRKQ